MKYCPGCKTTKSRADFYRAIKRYDGLQGECKACRKARYLDAKATVDYKGRACSYAAKHRILPMSRARILIDSARTRARRLGVPFDLDRSEIAKRIQNGFCEISGLRFDLEPTETQNNPRAPSIDRRNTKGGYTMDNVRVVCWQVNLARGEYGDAALLEMAEAIVRTISSQGSLTSKVQRPSREGVGASASKRPTPALKGDDMVCSAG